MIASRVRRGEQGAIMICGLFFCVLAVSLVYYVWGIAELIRYRETLQDAADGAAFSTAVVEAHGMNLLALLNMTMAALLAILVALRLVQLLVWVAIGIILAVGWMSGGALYSAITPLQRVNARVERIYDRRKELIFDLVKLTHKVANVAAKVVPAAGVARSVQVARDGYPYDVKFAVAIPAKLTLPVENDAFPVLCEHATEYATAMAMFPLPLPGKVKGGVETALGKLAAAGSGWFCGQKGAKPPSAGRSGEENIPLPVSETRERCLASLDQDLGKHEDPCGEAALFELQSLPDMHGECRVGRSACPDSCRADPEHCPPHGDQCGKAFDDPKLRAKARERIKDCRAYDWRRAQARVQCAPASAGGIPGLRAISWIQQPMIRTFRYDGVSWKLVHEEGDGDAQLVQMDTKSTQAPCGPRGVVGQTYSTTGHVCVSEGDCIGPGNCDRTARGHKVGDTFRERATVVRDMVQCIQRRKVPKKEREKQAKKVNVRPKGKDSDSISPFKLKDDLWLGDDGLQVRALAYGKGPSPTPKKGIEVAAWGQKIDKGVVISVAGLLENFGLAQGELAFQDGPVPVAIGQRHELLWKMGWRARLRPLRIPSKGGFCKGAKLSKKQGGICSKLDKLLAKKPWGKL